MWLLLTVYVEYYRLRFSPGDDAVFELWYTNSQQVRVPLHPFECNDTIEESIIKRVLLTGIGSEEIRARATTLIEIGMNCRGR